MPDNASNNKRIAKNTMFLYFRMILVLVVSLYTTRVVLNALGVVDYGINNVVAGFVSMFAFLNTTMSNGIQRFYNFKLGSEGEESITKVYTTALLIQGLLAVIIVVLLETVGLWYLNHKMVIPIERMDTARWIYQFSVLSLMLVIMQIPYSASIIAHERMDYFAYVSILEVMLKLGFALWLPHVEHDRLFVYGCYTFGAHVLVFMMYFIYSKYHFKALKLQRHFHKVLFKDMLSFSGWNVFSTFAYMLKSQGLNVLLNAFLGPVINAARGVSMMIGNAIIGFQSNIVLSFSPQIVQSYAGKDYTRVKNLMYSLSKISYILLFMLSVPVIIEIHFILKLWLGDTIPDYTVSFTILILINLIISSLNTPLTQVVHATGKLKHYQVGTSIVVCSILPISWLLLKADNNPIIVYVVSLTMTCINQVVSVLLLKRVFYYKISEYIKSVILPCFMVSTVSLVLPLLLYYFLPLSFIRLILVVISGVGSTIAASYLLALNEKERVMVGDFVKRILKRN